MNHKIELGKFYSKWYILLLWVLGISLLIGIFYHVFFGKDFSLARLLLPSLINTVVLWAGSMSIVIFVWRKFPWESKPRQHILVELSLIVWLLLLYITVIGFFLAYKNHSSFWVELKLNTVDIVFTVLITFLIITIHEAVFFYRQWKLHFSKSIQLEKDNLEAQYNTLKAQVNPHFLFNSLNSLMGLLDNHPTAEQYVQDLSEYLRYVLQSNTRELVDVDEEMESVAKFLNLQKLRFGENLHTHIELSAEARRMQIPPLTIQMLIENCIKHNTISGSKPLTIRVYNTDNAITVENNIQLKQSHESTGHGLRNIEGRYRFLAAKPIQITTTETHFSVSLPLIFPKL